MKKALAYKLQYSGLNFSSFLNFLLKNNIGIFNIEKVNNREYYFYVSSHDYNRYKKLKPAYNISVIKNGGAKKFFSLILQRVGVCVGVLIVLTSSLLINKKTLSIKIIGTNLYDQQILNDVQKFGIEIGKINNFSNSDLEKYLLEKNENLSLASVKKKGNSIIINVVEKLQNDNLIYEPFYSPYNLVIKEVELISGTLNIDENDVVKKGSVLVEPYTIASNGDRVAVPAKAKIIADVWFCGSESANKENVIYEKTDNKKVYKKIDFLKTKTHKLLSPFNNFMTETTIYNVSNTYFLPIFLTTTTFYETVEKIEIFDFENEKNNYLEKSKQKAYTILPKNVIINEITQNITELEDKYIFQTYLKATMEINNED